MILFRLYYLFLLFFVSAIFVMTFNSLSFSQGCSDAGLCTLHGLKPDEADTKSFQNNKLSAGVSYGIGDYKISVTTFYLSYYRKLSKKLGIDIKSTASIQKGNGISSAGFSDIFISADYFINEVTNFVLGTKIPLNRADKSQNSIPLPMNYQSSLGTWDIISGVYTIISKAELSLAFQQPMTQNDNQFFSNKYPLASKLSTFQSTNKFVRKGDILFRASYPLTFGKKFVLTPGILPIFHLGNDKYTDSTGTEVEINGSAGLTFNMTVFIDYLINGKNKIQINAGAPIITRDSKPEGMGRSLVIAINYTYLF